jgi:hypothetical protein
MLNESDSWYWEKTWSDFRRGSQKIQIVWEDGRATALLYDQGVPKTVAVVVAHLPLAVPMVHAAWSGEMVMSSRAFDLPVREMENQVRLVRPGDLGWDPKFGELTVTYGTAECRLPSGPNTIVVFGQVIEGLDAFGSWARARRFLGLGELRFV